MKKTSPDSQPYPSHMSFPMAPFHQLLEDLNWSDHDQWQNQWLARGGQNLASSSWPSGTKAEWTWGLGFPFLSDIERYLLKTEDQALFGISGLPGSGKTSFGRWIEAVAAELQWPLKVISMDDFYLPSQDMQKAMANNPWEVPRGLPGSHSIDLLEETIENWQMTGHLRAPQFDKALRNGLGDRCGWNDSEPQILILEGWFLGCTPADTIRNDCNHLSYSSTLTPQEKDYQFVVQDALKKYQNTWEKLNRLWHLKAIDFMSTAQWKLEQEMNMQRQRGASLKGKSLDLFIRMIQTAIPQNSLQSIQSDVVVKVNSSRDIHWIGLKQHEHLHKLSDTNKTNT